MNSGLIKMQFSACYFTFTGKLKLIIFIFRCFSGFLRSFFENSYFSEFFSEAYLEPSRTYLRWSFFAKIVSVNCFRKNTPSYMFDWVLNTPLFLDGYYLHSPYVRIFVPECFKNVVSRS